MYGAIVSKELRETLLTAKFVTTFLVGSVLILLAFYVGARNYEVSRSQYEAAQSENLRQMEGLTDWSEVEHRVFLPPQPLAALVTGISNDIGRNVQIEGRGDLLAEDSRFNDDPVYAAFRFLDLDFVFKVVLSLFAIVFGYNAISGEKEQGTLRLCFAQPVRRSTYILGKLTGSYLALALPLLLPLLLGSMLLLLMRVPMTGDDWTRLGLLSVAAFLFLGVFLTLSLFVSSLTHRSSSSFLILLVLWIFSVLIVPRTAVLLAAQSVNVLHSDEIAAQKAELQTQLWEEDKEKMTGFAPASTNMQEQIQEFSRFMEQVQDEREEKRRQFSDRLAEERHNQEVLQRRLALSLARMSPTASFSLAAMNLSGTSLALKERYQDQLVAYQQTFAQFQRDKTGRASGGAFKIRLANHDEEPPEPIDPSELPEFRFEPTDFRTAVRNAVADFGLLSLFNLVFLAGTFLAFSRYDMR